MRRYIVYYIDILLLTMFFTSCGGEKGRFRIEGQLKNMNQAEFYIYGADVGAPALDTIKVAKGRFIYETDLDHLATFIMLFPNGSEQAVFGESGAVVEMKGDASHLKEMDITGTGENEQMTEWRMNANRLTPPEVKKAAVDFIKEHPASVVSNYLLQRYVVQGTSPDYKTGAELAALMLKQQPENGRLMRLEKQLRGLKYAMKGAVLPDFKATDLNGNSVSRQSLKAELNVISVWAMWNYESQSQQRRLNQLKKDYGGRLTLLGISLDARQEDSRKFLERDSMKWSNVCDGRMWQSPLVQQLGISDVPGNIFIDRQGKVIDVNVPANKLEERVKDILK